MFAKLMTKFFGSRNEREINRLQKYVEQINALEAEVSKLSDEQLQAKTPEFKQRIENGEPLDNLLPQAFAVVREASKRVLGMRHFDVQLIGGATLHEGKIAEMRTGEGKTLVATLPSYLNALSGKGVHIVTVNDYLAKRDSEWMGRIHKFLGLSVGAITAGLNHQERQQAYACDITYGTNNEFGFDYLRDNMSFYTRDKVQRPLNFAIIDEVDSILIDEARTPLIISGPIEDNPELYVKINQIIPNLDKQEKEEEAGDYLVDEKSKQIHLSEAGHDKIEKALNKMGLLPVGESLYDLSHIALMHHVNAAIRAHALFHKEVDYIIENNQVVIIDEFTGRKMEGRRWSEGLHQAIEAKEGVEIKQETQTLASITFQNYFRLYEKLSGMTGTADTEAFEFQQIYGLEVLIIPTHRTMVRDDRQDLIYLDMDGKFKAVIEDIKAVTQKGQPVLVGTASVEVSEYLSSLLKKQKIKHEVLNAKNHEREAEIIAQAGRPGAITIATNMAGRGTDIILGGNLEMELNKLKQSNKLTPEKEEILRKEWQERHDAVLKAGGLHVIGTERHESRRIDNQLRGRAGRQGDVGSTRFYVSLQDNLMRIFGSDKTAALLQKVGMKEGEAIEHPWISKTIENSQRKVEAHNFDIRKNLLEYDDVANEQRKEIYKFRDELLEGENIKPYVESILDDILSETVTTYIPPQSLEEQWDISTLETTLEKNFHIHISIKEWLEQTPELSIEEIHERILDLGQQAYIAKEQELGEEQMRHFERSLLLQILDQHWKEHIAAMDYLRQGINLRGYAQKNPKQEYKRESFEMFKEMSHNINRDIASIILRVQIQRPEELQKLDEHKPKQMKMEHSQVNTYGGETQEKPKTVKRDQPKVGRNDSCPCGSGKKYKHCCGKETA